MINKPNLKYTPVFISQLNSFFLLFNTHEQYAMKNSWLRHWSGEKNNDNDIHEKEGKHKPLTRPTRSGMTYNSHIKRRALCYRDRLE